MRTKDGITQAGLIDNLEFNVELKDRADYEFALAKFNELWENAVDVKDKYIETIQSRTWRCLVELYPPKGSCHSYSLPFLTFKQT